MPRQVFLSYSTDDTPTATTVRNHLEAQGIACWMAPRDITPGKDYGEQIINAIEDATVLLLILSESSNTSTFVRHEVERAVSKGKVILPYRIQPVQPSRSLEFFISNYQWIDGWELPMVQGRDALVDAIQNHLAEKTTHLHTLVPSPQLVTSSPPSNLPHQLTPLVGREQEVAAVRALLQRENVRLVTLIGPPGTGKTRLGLRVAATLVDEFQEGVFFVVLAPVRDAALVASTIAQALGMKEEASQSLTESLKHYLQDKRMLLVLDNFEQVMPAALLVSELLAAAPHLKVLVTSREVLSLSGEYEFVVPPLPLPNLHQLPSLDILGHSPAVALFVQRAQAVKPDFRLTEENAPAVAELCTLLDGLPLVIELAAARTKLFSPREMLTRLGSRFQWLIGGARDLPVHQQTLQGTLDWSYNLLGAGEQTLLRRLGVFVGGCSLETIEVVCHSAGDLPIDLLAGIASLMDKSLLQRHERIEAEPRFGMLETIREYALEQLQASGEAVDLQRQHAEYFLKFVEESTKHQTGPEQGVWLDRLEAELGNLRAVLTWSKAEVSRIELGLLLAAKLYIMWNRRGHMGEGRAWLNEFLARPESSSYQAARAGAVRAAGVLAMRQDDYAVARPLLEESIELGQTLEDKRGLAFALLSLGNLERFQNHYERAIALYEESLALCRALEYQFGIANNLSALGDIALLQSEFAKATALYEESLALHRALENQHGIGLQLNALGRAAQQQGKYEQAQALYEESLALYRDLGNNHLITWILIELGSVAQAQDEYDRAKTLYKESLMLARQVGLKRNMAECLVGLAGVAGQVGQVEQAVRLFGAAERLLDSIGTQMDPLLRAAYERNVADVRAKLSEEAFAALWAKGQTMTREQAIAYASSIILL